MSSIHNTDLMPTTAIQQRNTEAPLKSTGHVPFTEKHSKVLKSSSGLKLEIAHSLNFHHEKSVPLLVSSALLRKRFLGQIDLARLVKDRAGWLLEIGEVKSSDVGVEMLARSQ